MEIGKEDRLPLGFKSWWELLQLVPSQDELPLKDNPRLDNRIFIERFDSRFWDNTLPITKPPHEIFEGDVLTLKVRGFDELKEIIPDKQKLIEYYHMSRLNSPTHTPLQEFLEKLINLT